MQVHQRQSYGYIKDNLAGTSRTILQVHQGQSFRYIKDNHTGTSRTILQVRQLQSYRYIKDNLSDTSRSILQAQQGQSYRHSKDNLTGTARTILQAKQGQSYRHSKDNLTGTARTILQAQQGQSYRHSKDNLSSFGTPQPQLPYFVFGVCTVNTLPGTKMTHTFCLTCDYITSDLANQSQNQLSRNKQQWFEQWHFDALNLFFYNRWTKRCTEWQPRRGKRSRGRPSRRWQDDITEKEGTTWIRKVTDRR